MTAAAIAAIGILVYPAVAAAVLVRAGKRVDVAFVRDMHRVLRSHAGGGSGEADQSHPQGRSAPAGVEPRCPIPLAPPAPCSLVGAVGRQTAAPTRPPRVAVHG